MYSFVKLANKMDAAALITASGFYGTITFDDIKGTDVYGMSTDGIELVACMVTVRAGAQAYVDYLCVAPEHRNKGVASKLTRKICEDLKKHGVRVIHACVSGENGASMKLSQALNAKIGWPFVNVSIRLEDYDG